MMKSKLKILSVKIEHKVDDNPDTSYLGKYSDTYASCEQAIIRVGEHAGEYVADLPDDYEIPARSNEYRFFIPARSGIETGNPDSPKQDYQRMEALFSGEWCYLGIIAKAELWNPETQVTQVVRSGGLWGIESDSDGEFVESVTKEELASLKAELLALGIGERAIEHAFKKVETVND